MTYLKTYINPKPGYVVKSALTQQLAANMRIAPRVLSTDNESYIVMEHLDEMCIADKWGENLDELETELADKIRAGIKDILCILHGQGIEYLDVTPYNFIEKDGRVWVIDFDDVKYIKKGSTTKNAYLKPIIRGEKQLYWNPAFK